MSLELLWPIFDAERGKIFKHRSLRFKILTKLCAKRGYKKIIEIFQNSLSVFFLCETLCNNLGTGYSGELHEVKKSCTEHLQIFRWLLTPKLSNLFLFILSSFTLPPSTFYEP